MHCRTPLSKQQKTNPLMSSASSQSLSTHSDPLLAVARIRCKFAAPLFSGDERKGVRNGSWVILRKSGGPPFTTRHLWKRALHGGALERVRVVIVCPQQAGNVGSVCRVATNFGEFRSRTSMPFHEFLLLCFRFVLVAGFSCLLIWGVKLSSTM